MMDLPPSSLLTIRRPDDFHVHLREGSLLHLTVKHSGAVFGRVVPMPNLHRPLVTVQQALWYRQEIMRSYAKWDRTAPAWNVLPPLYLSPSITKKEVVAAKHAGLIGIKYYPKGSTTRSSYGVDDLKKVFHVLEAMEREGLVLMVHAEATDAEIDIFDLEKVFLEKELTPLLKRFEGLKITVEHVSSKEGVDFVRSHSPRVGGTLTAHHLFLNRNDMLFRHLKPHHYCLPILKTERDRQALVEAATSGESCFFLGTDSAPHPLLDKEGALVKPGLYTAPLAMSLYVEVFEKAGKLDRLEAFSSLHGARFYGLEPNTDTIVMIKEPLKIPRHYRYGKEKSEIVVPFRAGEDLSWRLKEKSS